jgi:hypothetical protein
MGDRMICFAVVLPHILRGVALIGVDLVMAPLSTRQSARARLARDLRPELLAEMTRVEPMSKVTGLANAPGSIGRRIRVAYQHTWPVDRDPTPISANMSFLVTVMSCVVRDVVRAGFGCV